MSCRRAAAREVAAITRIYQLGPLTVTVTGAGGPLPAVYGAEMARFVDFSLVLVFDSVLHIAPACLVLFLVVSLPLVFPFSVLILYEKQNRKGFTSETRRRFLT